MHMYMHAHEYGLLNVDKCCKVLTVLTAEIGLKEKKNLAAIPYAAKPAWKDKPIHHTFT